MGDKIHPNDVYIEIDDVQLQLDGEKLLAAGFSEKQALKHLAANYGQYITVRLKTTGEKIDRDNK